MEKIRQTIIEEIEKICEKKRIGKRSLKILNETIKNMVCLTSEQKEVIEKVQQLNDHNKLKKEDIDKIREIAQQVKDVFISDDEIMKRQDMIYNVSAEHPMTGIKYDKEQQHYEITVNKQIIYEKELKNACEIRKKDILENEQVFDTQVFNVSKKVIKYQDKYIILFIASINNEPTILFDIVHIIILLNDVGNERVVEIIKNTDIYDGCVYFEPNEYGGYIVRDLINTDTVYQIVEESKSKLSESFENDVTKIIDDIKQKMSDASTKQIVLLNDDTIIKQIDSDAGYNYSKEKPMDGISYNEGKGKYLMRIDSKQKYGTNLSKMCDSMRREIINKNGKTKTEIVAVCKKVIKYQNKNLISFWYKHNNEINPLFDIKHILMLLDVDERQMRNIKSQIKDESKFIYFEPNEYNGYITRELIDEKTTYQIVLDSRSEFSKSFKSVVSDILIELRKNGAVQFNKPVKEKSIIKSTLSDTVNTLSVANGINTGIKLSDDKMRFVLYLIQKGQQIILNPYNNEHVLYFFITNIQHPNDFVICKIGYTSNIIGRCKQLENEYEGADFHLIGIKRIKNEQQEQVFHALLKSRYSQLVYNGIEIRKIQKEEIYIFDDCLWNEFNTIIEETVLFNTRDISQIMTTARNLYLSTSAIQSICDAYKATAETKRLELEIKKIQLEIELEKLRSTRT